MTGDIIKVFFKDDTFNKFKDSKDKYSEYLNFCSINFKEINVVYEDESLLIVNKPFGILSQKSAKSDISINEIVLSYLFNNGYSYEDYIEYKPGILNRLDRNTGGLCIFAKNRKKAVLLTEDIKNKKIRRIYNAILFGKVNLKGEYVAYYNKDTKNNIAIINKEKSEGFTKINTIFNTLNTNDEYSLCEIELKTGKSHQIRSMSKYLGHPIVNDKKYNGPTGNKYKLPGQYLIANKLIFPDGLVVEIDLPKEFKELI